MPQILRQRSAGNDCYSAKTLELVIPTRNVRGAGGGRAPPIFGRSTNPIQTRGAYYAPLTLLLAPTPRIQKAIYTSVHIEERTF